MNATYNPEKTTMSISTLRKQAQTSAPYLLPVLLIAAIVFAACQRDDDDGDISNASKVYSYDNRLSAISAEGCGYWIGSEVGGICHVCGEKRQFFTTPLGRVYDVVRDTDDSTSIWIGSRNAGVQQWRIEGDTLVHVRTYNMPGKGSKYSPYDLQMVAGRIYAATSQGVFVVPEKGDTATNIIPLHGSIIKKPYSPNPVTHLTTVDDRWLYASSDSGLLRYDIRQRKFSIIRQPERTHYVTAYRDTLYVLTDHALMKETADGRVISKVDLDFHARAFYKHGDVNIFLTPKSVYMSYNLTDFKKLDLWSGVNPGAYNLLLPDDGRGFAVVLAGSDECHLPHHFNLESHGTGQQLIAADGATLYFIDEEGFVYRANGGEKKARILCQLPDNQRPVMLAALDGEIYYVTADNGLYRLKLYTMSAANQLFARPRLLLRVRTHATAIHAMESRKTILVGVQDELITYNAETGATDSVRAMHGKYITQFYSPKGSDDIYVSTLNDGIFVYNDNALKQVPGTASLSQIQGISMRGSYDPHLFILTNHKLFRYGGDSIAIHGDMQLAYADDSTIYTLPPQGLHRYRYAGGRFFDEGVSYADINFQPLASIAMDKRLYLGSELGTAVLTPGKKGSLEWMRFSRAWVSIWYVLGSLLIVSVLVLQFVFVRRNRHRGDMKQLALQVDDLNQRMRGLELMEGHLTDKQAEWLDNIIQQLAKVDVNTKDWRKAYDTLARLSVEVSSLNRDAALQIVKALESQMKEILLLNCYDSNRLIKASTEAHESGVVDNITQQFVKNKQWLDRVKNVQAKVRHYQSGMEGALRLKGVDDAIIDALAGWNKTLFEKPLGDVEKDVNMLENLYTHLYSDEAMGLINAYMDTREQYLAKRRTYAYVAGILLEQLKTLHVKAGQMDRAELLRELSPIERQVQQISTLHHLRKCMRAYAENDDTGKENVANIAKYIDRFYTLFKQADPEVVDDILRFPTADNQQVKVLVLLIADKKVKRTLLPGMLGLYGNLNPVVSRLYHGKIGENLEKLNNYCLKHPTSLTYYILQLEKV